MDFIKQCPKSLSGSALKRIAVVTMLIDHIGYVLLLPAINHGKLLHKMEWMALYILMRIIGRIAFPLFCFLLVEGFVHTHSPKRYLVRLALFSLISEIPFDIATAQKQITFRNQNVFFTLAIGLLLLILLRRLEGQTPLQVAALVGCCLLSALIRSDYDITGVLIIAIFWRLRARPRDHALVAAPVLAFSSMYFYCMALLALLPISCYNGERGSERYPLFFYWFYPVHLLVLALIRYAIMKL